MASQGPRYDVATQPDLYTVLATLGGSLEVFAAQLVADTAPWWDPAHRVFCYLVSIEEQRYSIPESLLGSREGMARLRAQDLDDVVHRSLYPRQRPPPSAAAAAAAAAPAAAAAATPAEAPAGGSSVVAPDAVRHDCVTPDQRLGHAPRARCACFCRPLAPRTQQPAAWPQNPQACHPFSRPPSPGGAPQPSLGGPLACEATLARSMQPVAHRRPSLLRFPPTHPTCPPRRRRGRRR